jgi:hypothetical protein
MKWILPICAVAVVFGIVATMTIPAQTITPDQGTLKLFPLETTALVAIDVAGLRTSQLFVDFQGAKRYPANVQAFIDATGFQPDRDIDQITAAKIGMNEGVAIIRARYDPFQVQQFLQGHNVLNETYLGRVLYTFDVQRLGRAEATAVSFIDGVIVAGQNSAVKQVLDRMAAPAQSVLDNSALMDQVRSIEAGNQVWTVGQFDLESVPLPARVPSAAVQFIRNFTGGAFQVRVDSGVHVKALPSFTTDDAARQTADVLRGLVAVAKFQSAQNPDLLHLLDGIAIDYSSGSVMTVRFDAEGDLLKKVRPPRKGVGD